MFPVNLMEKADISSKLLEEMKKMQQISARQLDLARKAQVQRAMSDEVYRLMEEREAIRQGIDQLKEDFPQATSVMDFLNPEQGQTLRGLINSIEANDQETRSITEALMKSLQNKIQSARKSQKALTAYSPPSLNNPWFFDKKK
ncbi:MAG: flagellar protein FliT [Syntrophomonas sp.]